MKKIDVRPPVKMEDPVNRYGEEEREPFDIVMAGQNIIPELLHGLPSQELEDHYDTMAFFQLTNMHYSEEDLLADLKYSINKKHRKEHDPVAKKVISESLKHAPQLHDLYFN